MVIAIFMYNFFSITKEHWTDEVKTFVRCQSNMRNQILTEIII